MARGFLKRADPKRFGELSNDLKNLFARGTDQYPNDIADAYAMLANFNPTPGSLSQPRGHLAPSPPRPAIDDGSLTEMSFAQAGTLAAGNYRKTHEGITCFKCKKLATTLEIARSLHQLPIPLQPRNTFKLVGAPMFPATMPVMFLPSTAPRLQPSWRPRTQ